MIKVFLREKKLKNAKRGLYLDFYPPVPHEETGQHTRREHLKLYIYEKPKTEIEKNHNKETLGLAQNIRAQRQLELQSGAYGFVSNRHRQKSFLDYFAEAVKAKKAGSAGYYTIWCSTEKHLKTFSDNNCRFVDVTEKFCSDFRDYLAGNSELRKSTAVVYFQRFKSVVKQAFDKSLLPSNPVKNIKGIKSSQTQREFLTLEELIKLSKTPVAHDELRRAALFSAFTGLRFSDIHKLTWGEIQSSREHGNYIRFTQKKTGTPETLPISEEALEILGERRSSEDKVLDGFYYWHCKQVGKWAKDAGIDKKITFHSFRHTYATLQLTLGTDIFTVSKMLGHRDLKTTQIYAKIIDAKKREAANKISLK